MTSERVFNSFIHPQKLLYPPKQISGYAPGWVSHFSRHFCYRRKVTKHDQILSDPVMGGYRGKKGDFTPLHDRKIKLSGKAVT